MDSLSTSMVNAVVVTQLDRPLLGKLRKATILDVSHNNDLLSYKSHIFRYFYMVQYFMIII